MKNRIYGAIFVFPMMWVFVGALPVLVDYFTGNAAAPEQWLRVGAVIWFVFAAFFLFGAFESGKKT